MIIRIALPFLLCLGSSCTRAPDTQPVDEGPARTPPVASIEPSAGNHVVNGRGVASNPALARARAIADAKAEAGRIRALDVSTYLGGIIRSGDPSAGGIAGSDAESVSKRSQNLSAARFDSTVHGPESMEQTGSGQFTCRLCLSIPMWQLSPSACINDALTKADPVSAMRLVADRFEEAGIYAWSWECWQAIAGCPLATEADRARAGEAQNRLQQALDQQR